MNNTYVQLLDHILKDEKDPSYDLCLILTSDDATLFRAIGATIRPVPAEHQAEFSQGLRTAALDRLVPNRRTP